MNPSKRMYIDCKQIKKLINNMSSSELLYFLGMRLLIPIDDETYDFLISLKDDYFFNNLK